MSTRKGPPRGKKQRLVEADNLQDSDIEEELFGNCDEDDDYEPGSDSEEYSSDEDRNRGLTFEQLPLDNIELRASNARPNEPSTSGSASNWTSTINAFSGAVDGHEPINYFDFFFDQQLFSMICTETNAQAERLKSVNECVKGRIRDWKELSIPELKIFLGLLLHMGTINLNRLQDYWKTDRLFNIPIFRQQMSRNRFLLILRCLHFTSESESEDPLYKIRNMIDYFNKKMENCYYPCKELSLDESMVLWRGRLAFKRYIKNKRHKCGVKLYMLTQSDGLILRFQVYSGGQDIDLSGKGNAEKVVMRLMEGKFASGHRLYMDNFYNSFGLAKRPLENDSYYPCERKTLRWYLKIAIHTLQLLFINSHRIYNQYSGQRKMSLYDYRLNVINALLPIKSEPEVGASSRSVGSRHCIRKITETNARGRIQRKMCRQCHKEKKRTDTSYQCVTCVEKPGLCPECFDTYHIEQNLLQ